MNDKNVRFCWGVGLLSIATWIDNIAEQHMAFWKCFRFKGMYVYSNIISIIIQFCTFFACGVRIYLRQIQKTFIGLSQPLAAGSEKR